MANNETTTKFKVDISELKKAMQDAKRQISIANSEFKEASSSMDDWSKSTDGISAKLKQLDSNLKSQKTILGSLEKQYEQVVAEQGEGSAAADRLKIAINNQKAAINKTEREISNYEASLEEVSEAEKIAAKTGKSVADVLEDIAEESKDAGDGFTVFKGAVATFAGNAITSLVGGIKDAASNILNLADETREYRAELGKLDTAFTTAGHTTSAATKTYKDLYAVLGDEGQSVEAANMLAKLCKNEEDLTKWTKIATGVYGTFGSSLPVEALAESANESAKCGQIAGNLADALNWAAKEGETFGVKLKANTKANEEWNNSVKSASSAEDYFNLALQSCSSEQERQQLITKTLTGLYGDAAKKYEETNGAIMDANRSQSDYMDTMATLGEKVEPITTKLKEGFNKLLEKILELVGDVDMEAFTTKMDEAFQVLTDDVLPAVKDGLGWIIDNKDALISGLAGIGAGFVAFKVASLINGVVKAFQAFKVAQEGATVAQWLMNAAMNANPIMLIVTLIAAVVTALVTFVATNDDARAKFKEIWQGVVDFFKKAVDGIVKFFTETIPKVFKNAIAWVKENFQALLLFMINPFAGLFKYFYDNNGKFKEFVDNAVKWIKELPKKVMSIGKDVVTGLWNGIGDKVTWLKNKVKDFVGNVTGWLKKFFKIGSPSKLMRDEIGKWLPEGIAVGIDKNAKSVINSMRNLAVDTVNVARDGLTNGVTGGVAGGGVVNNFTQVINSPKQLSRLDIYRQSKNLLGYAGGGR